MSGSRAQEATRVVKLIVGKRNAQLLASERETVIDLLERMRVEHARDLGYRHSCHHGSCGTCGMMINGVPALACLTTVGALAAPLEAEEVLQIHLAPLRGFPVVADLVTDTSGVAASFPEGALEREKIDRSAGSGRRSSPPQRPAAERFTLCIECGLCVAACPVSVPFLGPAALAAINRTRKAQPERAAQMLERAAQPDGVGPCERHLACSKVCPTGVYPARHIAELRRAIDEWSPSER